MLDTEDMYLRIKEILPVNPYLAVWTYTTAESDDKEKAFLLNQLISLNELEGESIIQKALAFDLLGEYRLCNDTLYSFFGRIRSHSSDTFLPEISDYWWKQIGTIIVSKRYVSIWPVYLRYFLSKYGDLGFAEKDKIISILRGLYETGEYGRLLQATEQTGLYGELVMLVEDFPSFFLKVIDLYIAGKLQYAIDYYEEGNAMQKLTALYLLKGYDSEAILERTKDSKLKNKLHLGKDTLYWFVHNWKHNSYGKRSSLPLSKDNARKWSSGLNATPHPVKILHGMNSCTWWEGRCGHIWQRSIKLMERDGSCPYCGEK